MLCKKSLFAHNEASLKFKKKKKKIRTSVIKETGKVYNISVCSTLTFSKKLLMKDGMALFKFECLTNDGHSLE